VTLTRFSVPLIPNTQIGPGRILLRSEPIFGKRRFGSQGRDGGFGVGLFEGPQECQQLVQIVFRKPLQLTERARFAGYAENSRSWTPPIWLLPKRYLHFSNRSATSAGRRNFLGKSSSSTGTRSELGADGWRVSRATKSLILYKRHLPNCPVHNSRVPIAKRRFWMDCDCPIWIHGRTPSGDIVHGRVPVSLI